jgi:hypothetical protein
MMAMLKIGLTATAVELLTAIMSCLCAEEWGFGESARPT